MKELTIFESTENALALLESQYKDVIVDASTTEGYESCNEAIKQLRPLRINLEKTRLSLNSEDQGRIKQRNTLAKNIQLRLTVLEEPRQAAKKFVDDELKREAQAKIDAEKSRIEEINKKTLYFETVGNVGSIQELTVVLKSVKGFDTKTCDEFTERAEIAKNNCIARFEAEIKRQTDFEEQRKEQQKQQEIIQAENEKIEREKAEISREKQQIEIRKQAIKDKEIMDKREQAEIKRLEIEKIENKKLQDARDETKKQQYALKKINAEKKRIDDENKAKIKEQEKLKLIESEKQRKLDLMPDLEKINCYYSYILNAKTPVISDEKLNKLFIYQIKEIGKQLATYLAQARDL